MEPHRSPSGLKTIRIVAVLAALAADGLSATDVTEAIADNDHAATVVNASTNATVSTTVATGNAVLAWTQAAVLIPRANDPIWKLEPADVLHRTDAEVDALFAKPCPVLDLFALGAAQTTSNWDAAPALPGTGPYADPVFCWAMELRLARLHAAWAVVHHDPGTAVNDLLTMLRAARIEPGAMLDEARLLRGSCQEFQCIRDIALLAPALGPEQRRRLIRAAAGLPPWRTMLETLPAEESRITAELDRLAAAAPAQRLSILRKVQCWFPYPDFTRNDDALAPVVADAVIAAARADIPVEIARWRAHLHRPLTDRYAKLEPTLGTTDAQVRTLLQLIWPAANFIDWDYEIRLRVYRAQLIAGLAWLDDRDAGLLAHPDPLSGQPYLVFTLGDAFAVRTVPMPNADDLILGEKPAQASRTAPAATAPANADF